MLFAVCCLLLLVVHKCWLRLVLFVADSHQCLLIVVDDCYCCLLLIVIVDCCWLFLTTVAVIVDC